MELKTLLKTLIRRWWLVITPAVVVVAYIAATFARPAPVYQVVMRFAAGTRPAGLSEDYDRYYPWLTSEYIANGLADIAETGAFAQAVATRLAADGLDIPAALIRPAIVSDNAQSILVIYLSWPGQEQIVPLAEAIGAELSENGSAYFPQLEGIEPSVRVLDTPEPFALPLGLRAQLTGPAIRIVLALVVGVALALVWHYLDPTVREADDLKPLDVPLLGEIPRR